jgi:MOSC domain-containing protein YiiM
MRLEAIYGCFLAGAPMRLLNEVQMRQGSGLEGDRYAEDRGHWSAWPDRSGMAVTLIAVEDLEELHRATGLDLRGGRHRRNLEVSGGRLGDLLGRRFRVGEAVLRGVRPCAPCRYLDGLTYEGAKEGLRRFGGGGLRAEVLVSGRIRVGDAVVLLDEGGAG